MEKTTELSEKALLYKSAIDLDNKKREESKKITEKVTLLLEAPSSYNTTKQKLGWNEEETYLAQQNSNISFLESLKLNYPDHIILDQEEVLKLCIKHDYVLIPAKEYKYKTSKDLIATISEYFEKRENIYPDDICLLIPSYLNLTKNLSELQIIEYRNSVKTDDILVLHKINESRNAEINYYCCLNPINQVKKDTRSWFKKVLNKTIYLSSTQNFFINMTVLSFIITLILFIIGAAANNNILNYYSTIIISTYLLLTSLLIILPKVFQTKISLFYWYESYSLLKTSSENKLCDSSLYNLLKTIYYTYSRTKLQKFELDYFKSIMKKDNNTIVKKFLIFYIGLTILLLTSYYGYYYMKTNTNSNSYTFTQEERELTNHGSVIDVTHTYEIKRNNFFSYTKKQIN